MTWSSILTSLLYIVFILMPPSSAEKKMCTKRVEGVTTKVPQTRRIPAKCSNWDRAWTWVTHNDCGTKYQITYMELHQQNQYRLVYECCPGDEDCKREGQKDHESDERFLAITFGCASAAFIILIIIIVISVCRKKHAGFIFCPYRKNYENADESPVGLGCHGERSDPNDYVIGDLGEERKLVLESEYEEICDINPTLKGGATWDSMYQKTPSAPPQETHEGRESREPALPVASGNIEFREQPRNLPEEKLVEIDTNESENGTGMTNLINIEREREDVSSSTNSGGVLGVESSNISSDDSHQRVFENNHLTDKQSPVEILQPIKAEDQPQSGGDYKITDQNTDSSLSDPNIDLVTSLKSGNDLSVVDTITEKDKTNPPVQSGNHDEVYEELH